MSGDWELLTDEQKRDVDAVRKHISEHIQQYLASEVAAFAEQHPELYLSWSFECYANIRALHDLIPL